MRLQIKKMTVNNFRQFSGMQSVEFSTDPGKNVTVIMGGGGAGKTSLAQAFKWCICGDTDFEYKELFNMEIGKSVVSDGESFVKVELVFAYLGKEYTLVREQKYAADAEADLLNQNDDHSVPEMVFQNDDGQQEFVRGSDADARMRKIFPRELFERIFYDAEKIVKKAMKDFSAYKEQLTIGGYPLIIDGPLTLFGKTRREKVCEALPQFADQVIIFVGDTEEEIVENIIGSKVGKWYRLCKKTIHYFPNIFS